MKITLAIITCRRPQAVQRLLASLEALQVPAPYTLSLLVVDNDARQSARSVLAEYREAGRFPLTAVHEPAPGIPHARNAALKAAQDADYLVWLDDDETATPCWLACLLDALQKTRADAVGGPVLARLAPGGPRWINDAPFFARAAKAHHAPCAMLSTNNCLFNLRKWRERPVWFETGLQFTGSSDTLFFMRLAQQGWRFGWSATASVSEEVPLQRQTAAWIIQRQYRIGNGLSLCDVMVHGLARAALPRLAKAAVYFAVGCLHLLRLPLAPEAGWVKARATWARARGTLSGLYGHRYEEYAPARLIGEAP